MTKITLGLLIIATCLSLLTTTQAEARTKTVSTGTPPITNTDLGSGR